MKTKHQLLTCVLILLLTTHPSFATDSSSPNFRVNAYPNQIITMEKGWIKRPGSSSSQYQYFNTTKLCADGFNPYIDMSFSKTSFIETFPWEQMSVTRGHTRSFGICVVQISPRSNGYSVTYWSVKNYANVYGINTPVYGWRSQDENFYPMWSTNERGVYDHRTTRKLGYQKPEVAGATRYNDIGAINWTLYCVPDKLDLPYTQWGTTGDQCETDQPPFYNAGP